MADRPRVFIDGHVGTTGLRIRDWLQDRADLELLSLDESRRKDPSARRDMLGAADLAVLCLPDEAAREAAAWVADSDTRLIDASTAHRVHESWVFGLPEMSADQPGQQTQREAIRVARLVSNPGCYPIPVVLSLRPMIERWQSTGSGLLNLVHDAPYALDRVHKHIPEIARFSLLERPPAFVPSVLPFRTGMRVEVVLHEGMLARGASGKSIWEVLRDRYTDEPFVRLHPLREPLDLDERDLDPRACDGTNRIELHVIPNPAGHVLLVGVLDNLGKGAAGTAIQNLNLMLGLAETEGLRA